MNELQGIGTNIVCPDTQAEKIMKRLDKDNDKLITVDEFIEGALADKELKNLFLKSFFST